MSPLVESLSAFFAARNDDVVAAYLFGSEARGTAHATSDVDIAVLRAREEAPTLAALPLRLEGELERHVGRRVQVVALDLAPVDLVHRVLRDGLVLFDRDKAARLRFEVKARAEYLDLVPVLRRYRRQQEAP